MTVKYFEPVILKQRYYEKLEKYIQDIFDELFYYPLGKVFNTEITNASDTLLKAIKSGKINYVDGYFIGCFNAAFSAELKKLGAKWDGRKKAFVLAQGNLPLDIVKAIIHSQERYAELLRITNNMIDDVERRLADFEISKEIAEKYYVEALTEMDKEFTRTLAGVVPKFNKEQKQHIAAEWTNNLDLYVKKWSNENVVKLRQKVQKNVQLAQRSEGLIKTIQQNYGTSKAKAKFLARQETSLLLSKMREVRYIEAGLPEYVWSTSMDQRVRPADKKDWKNPLCDNHRILEGTVQQWAIKPVVDGKNGRTAHPGEDYNCRCNAIAFFGNIIK